MSVNSVNSVNSTAAYTAPAKSNTAKAAENTNTSKDTSSSNGAVYEKGSTAKPSSSKGIYSKSDIVARMKRDTEQRTAQLKSLVEKMMTSQGSKIGQADDMWRFLAKGNFTVSADVKAQAQADIAEDGYWGVKQTSQRILDFATALTGGDPSKIEKMRSAFQKGYDKAQKTWGGQLPAISQQTYDAVLSGFDKMAQEAGIQS